MRISSVAFLCVIGACGKSGSDAPGPKAGSQTQATPDPTPVAPDAAVATANPDLSARYVACLGFINAGRWADLRDTCLAKSFHAEHADGEALDGAGAMIGVLEGMRLGLADLEVAPQLVMRSDRELLSVVLVTGTHTAALKLAATGDAFKPAGKRLGVQMLLRIGFDATNRIDQVAAYFDSTTILGQLGQLPPSADPTRPASDTRWPGAPILLATEEHGAERDAFGMGLVKTAHESCNAHELSAMSAVIASDAIESDQAGEDHRGRQNIENGTRAFITALPDVKVQPDKMYAAGGYVITLGRMTGKYEGKPIEAHYGQIARVEKDKIAQIWRFRDSAALLAQLQ